MRQLVEALQARFAFELSTGAQLCHGICHGIFHPLRQGNAVDDGDCHDKRGGKPGHCDARAVDDCRSSHACAAGKRARPGTVAPRLIDFHFGSKPGPCSLSIRENR